MWLDEALVDLYCDILLRTACRCRDQLRDLSIITPGNLANVGSQIFKSDSKSITRDLENIMYLLI